MRILTERQEVDLLNALTDAQCFNLARAADTSDPNTAAVYRAKAREQRDLARMLAAAHAIAISEPEPPARPLQVRGGTIIHPTGSTQP